MRRAAWRRRPDDPNGVYGWWWHGLLYEGGLSTLALWSFMVGVFLQLGHVSAAPLCIALSGIAFAAQHWAARHDPFRPMMPEPPIAARFFARADYRFEGLTTGSDFLVLEFANGWLYAEGVRSYFALRPDDVVSVSTTWGGGCALEMAGGDRIKFVRLDESVRDELKKWSSLPIEMEGASTLPPARVHPREFARWTMLLGASMFGGGVLRMAAGWFVPRGNMHMAIDQGGMLIALVGIAWAGRRLWRLLKRDDAVRAEEAREAARLDAPGRTLKGEARSDDPSPQAEAIRRT